MRREARFIPASDPRQVIQCPENPKGSLNRSYTMVVDQRPLGKCSCEHRDSFPSVVGYPSAGHTVHLRHFCGFRFCTEMLQGLYYSCTSAAWQSPFHSLRDRTRLKLMMMVTRPLHIVVRMPVSTI